MLNECPYCDADEWEYTEVSKWHGRRCDDCGGVFLHDDLGPNAPDMGENPRL